MKKKYLYFIVFFVLMAFSSDIAFLLPDFIGNPGSTIYIFQAGKVVGVMLALIIGYLKLGEFRD